MYRWTIRAYQEADGRRPIEEWYEAQPEALQARFDTRIFYLSQQPFRNWVKPHFVPLKGNYTGLGEVAFKFENVAYRPLGFFSDLMEFTLVAVPKKKGTSFEPRDAGDLGLFRASQVRLSKEKFSHEWVCH
jgi:hypothetical protein